MVDTAFALRSGRELNFPIGARSRLQMAGTAEEDDPSRPNAGRFRWLLPLELLDGVYAAASEDMDDECNCFGAYEVNERRRTAVKEARRVSPAMRSAGSIPRDPL